MIQACQLVNRAITLTPLYSGVALTCFALGAATYGVKKGRRAYANNMFRVRGKRHVGQCWPHCNE